jgi:hypothetical protein
VAYRKAEEPQITMATSRGFLKSPKTEKDLQLHQHLTFLLKNGTKNLRDVALAFRVLQRTLTGYTDWQCALALKNIILTEFDKNPGTECLALLLYIS